MATAASHNNDALPPRRRRHAQRINTSVNTKLYVDKERESPLRRETADQNISKRSDESNEQIEGGRRRRVAPRRPMAGGHVNTAENSRRSLSPVADLVR